MTDYAKDGVAVFVVLLLAGWWIARRSGDARRMATALWAGAGTIIAVGINQPIVNAVHESRPYAALPHVLLLVGRSADPSFPSDHATMAGAVAAGLFLLNKRLGLIAALAALLMAFARVYVGAHYPGDVLAGFALGAVVAALGQRLLTPVLTRLVTWATDNTPLRPLLTGRQNPSVEPVNSLHRADRAR